MLAQALSWMELQAMRTGLTEVDQSAVDSLFEADLQSARALEQDGHLLDALLRYRSAANDFAGLHPTTSPVADTLRLSRAAGVRHGGEGALYVQLRKPARSGEKV